MTSRPKHKPLTIRLSADQAERIKARSKRGGYSVEEQQEIIADWLAGATLSTLAKRFNRGSQTIGYFLQQVRAEAERVSQASNRK